MYGRAPGRLRAPRRALGLSLPGFDSILSSAEAAARAQLYQQLADFQKLPQRQSVVQQQLSTYSAWSASRGFDESAQLAALQTTLANVQSNWNSANAQVSSAISALTSGATGFDVAGAVASALASMTLSASATASVENDTRALISSSQAISDTQKQQLLAMGPGGSFSLTTALLWVGGGYLALKALKVL